MMRMRLLAAALAAVPVLAAEAAEPRPFVTLSGPLVRLGDLFDDAGENAGRVLGTGPAPGGRIVVGAAQLHAIARRFGVDWRPETPADRVILEWPGRPMPREAALAAIRDALVAAGAAPDCVLELPGFVPPMVPQGADPRPAVTQLDYSATTGRFTAQLLILSEGMEPIAARVSGTADRLIDLPVPALRLSAGAVLRPQDLRTARVSATLARGEVVRDPAEAVGMQLRRSVPAGQPLRPEDLVRPPAVARDAVVRIVLDARGLALSGQGVALESGALQERIRVRNPSSRAVLEAVVIAPGIVRVAADSIPLVTAQIAAEGRSLP